MSSVDEVIWLWSDRRPITTWNLFGDQAWSSTNPDCFLGVTDASDIEQVSKSVLKNASVAIQNTLAINGQGIYLHGLTWRYLSKNYPDQTSIQFSGFDDQAPALREILPSGDHAGKTLLRAVCDLVAAANLKIGCLIRPAFARGRWNDADVTKGRYQGHVNVDREIAFQYMKPSMDRAYKEGMRIFYVDSPGAMGYAESYLPLLVKEYQKDRPQDPCLFVPECTSGDVNHPSTQYIYKYGPAWGVGVIKKSISDLGSRSFFAVDNATWTWNNKGVDGIKDQVRRAYEVGHILSPYAWYQSRGYKAVLDVYNERKSLSGGTPSPFGP